MRRITLKSFEAATAFLIGICFITLPSVHPEEGTSLSTPATAPQPKGHGPVIFESSMRYVGMYAYVGKALRLRVYQTGYVEYDVIPENKPIRRTGQLTADELKSLVSMLGRQDLLTAKDEYPAFVVRTDTAQAETITFRRGSKRKRVVIINPAPTDRRAKSNYPESLIELLNGIEQLEQRLEK